MPLYTIHFSAPNGTYKAVPFVEGLIKLHSQTFDTDPAAVRVEFVLADLYLRFGGYGSTPTRGKLERSLGTTDYIVAEIDYQGSTEDWQAYCRKIVDLWRREFKHSGLRSVYLRRFDLEFEVANEKLPGTVIRGNENGEAHPPPYGGEGS